MKISARPLEALLAKMRAGFNNNLANVAKTYGIVPFKIDFPSSLYQPKGNSTFFFGQVSTDRIIEGAAAGLNLVSLYVSKSSNMNYEKPNDFSGLVYVMMDFHLAWKASGTEQNFELLTLAVEDAVSETLQAFNIQNWGPGVVYDGRMSATRSPIEFSTEGPGGARQLLEFSFAFQIDV